MVGSLMATERIGAGGSLFLIDIPVHRENYVHNKNTDVFYQYRCC